MQRKIRTAVIGVGQFGRNHARVVAQSPGSELSLVVDRNLPRALEVASAFGCPAASGLHEAFGKVDAAVVATPTTVHAETAIELLEAGIDVLVEKPIAPNLAEAEAMVQAARSGRRMLQVGHLERFNPAVSDLETIVNCPLFFEVHRLSLFSPRALDVDVVLDLMIHDLDIVLHLVGSEPEEIRAAGISILSQKVDIANVRLQFGGGVVANLTASRVSTEQVRKLRLFQPREYISLDYARQSSVVFAVGAERQVTPSERPIEKGEPLARQWQSFLEARAAGAPPRVDGIAATRNLRVALSILDTMRAHAATVAETVAGKWKPR